MSLSDVQSALVSAAVDALGGTKTELENVPFDRPSKEKWAQVFFMPNQPTPFSLGQNGKDMFTGLVQVNIRYPVGSGDEDARADFETFYSTFKTGYNVLHTSGQEARVTSCGRTTGKRSDNWYLVVITIEWWAIVPRQ